MKLVHVLLIVALFGFTSCMKGESADLVVHNAKIHTMDEQDHVYEAMAIKDGKIIELGPEREILNKYSYDEAIDAEGKEVYPGFTDAHGHIMSYAQLKMSVDLLGSTSYDDLIVRIEKYDQKKRPKALIGRGWDQATWGTNELPSNERINKLFPNKPVLLVRVDGHAALVNQKALDLAGIDPETKVEGGEVQVKDGKCTGVLLDNAIELVSKKMPAFSQSETKKAIKEVQEELFQYGITGVHEAGVYHKDLQLLKKMTEKGDLKLDMYVMLYPTDDNIRWAKQNGVYKKKNLTVRSFKVVGDGALGSRGAFLKKEYSDAHGHSGFLTTTAEKMEVIAQLCKSLGYQMNTHAIGDSTNRLVIDLITKYASKKADHRWRIEHAQVLAPADINLLTRSGAIPSIQPTHAVSDQRWAKLRLGPNRLAGAYAYQSILMSRGIVALGTDFPVESPNPFATIRAAVLRTNADGEPLGGFQSQEAISLHDCLMGMTLWAAMAGFQEEELGTLEVGKNATFFISSAPITSTSNFDEMYAYRTVIRGKTVFGMK